MRKVISFSQIEGIQFAKVAWTQLGFTAYWENNIEIEKGNRRGKKRKIEKKRSDTEINPTWATQLLQKRQS